MEDSNDNRSGTMVEVIEGGPLKITGTFILKDIKRGKETPMGEVWLCRCGKSSSKPFCDGSHKKA